jgi:hypothetical protein
VTVERINWQTAASQGAQVVYGVLIAGIPHLIVGDGVTVSTVAWTDAADPAWHAGTSPTTRPWLALDELTVEERIRPIDGGIDVSSITLRLADIATGVTAALGARDSLAVSTLTGGISASVTTIGIRSTAAMPSSGVIHIGRERITYTGKTSGSVTGCVRGTAGTKARRHQVTQGQAPPRAFAHATNADALPFTLGRRVTVWALQLSGTTVTDPTLIYDGRVGPNTRMSDGGAAWEIPVDHASKALAEETRAVEVYLYGYSHFTPARRTAADGEQVRPNFTPLYARWARPNTAGGGAAIFLTNGASYPDHGGWSASAEVFLDRWNDAARLLGTSAYAHDDANGYFVEAGASPGRRLEITWAWGEGGSNAYPANPGDSVTSARAYMHTPTEACLWLYDRLHLDPADLALIPAAPTGASGIVASWGLDVERDNDQLPKELVRVRVGESDGTNLTGVVAFDHRGLAITGTLAGERAFGAEILLTKPTRAPLRLYVQINARTAGWWDAIRYGVIESIDTLRGLDHVQDSLAWDRIESVAGNSQPWNWERTYWIAPEEPPLRALRDEATLSGLMLCTWRGRISVARIREPSTTETVTRTIGQADLRRGQLPTMREVNDGIISSVKLILPPHNVEKPNYLRVIDATAISESGAGAEITARVAEGAMRGGEDPRTSPSIRTAVENIALSLLTPWTRPYRLVTVPTDLRAADVEVGDVIALDEWLLPSGTGTRGISGRGVVVGHRRDYVAGRVDLRLRVAPARAGWAPAYAVDSITGDELTLDDPYPTSGAGFAPEYTSTGTQRDDLGLEYLAPGDKMRLVEVGNRSPATPLSVEVVSVDASLRRVTLTASPGASWETLATSSYGKVLLIPETHANSATTQRQYVYVADGSTVVLSTGDRAATWA